MNNITARGLSCIGFKMMSRSVSCTSALRIQKWREDRGLPVNKNAEGVLTDGPDYTFLDGRPTPLLAKQKLRMEKNQGYAKQIVELCSELDFAKRRHQELLLAKKQERENVMKSWLKPKGANLYKK